jgi:hypothetical protein
MVFWGTAIFCIAYFAAIALGVFKHFYTAFLAWSIDINSELFSILMSVGLSTPFQSTALRP